MKKKYGHGKFLYLGDSRVGEKLISVFVSITIEKQMNFLFEEIPNLNIEKNKIVQLCKSMYLSKISHEFKNPVCNLVEIISDLQDEGITNKTIISPNFFIKKNPNNLQDQMKTMDYLKCLLNFFPR
jgi:hypothetical protein